METVRRTRRPVTITKRGVPVVKLVPADPTGRFVLGSLAGTFTSVGDIVSSPLSDEEWKAIEQRRADQWALWARKGPARPKRAGRPRKAR
jgi:antitoxin (DNA-binding transcriptional repressor) of toxin-antitoxin stability system